jgi:DNA-binding NtrC family response regulator
MDYNFTQENSTMSSKTESKGYIIIINDYDNIRSTFASYLENFGYQVKMAKDESEAKTLVDQNIFDVAILDVCLPDYNGMDLLNELKKIQTSLEFIVCTAYSDNYDFFGAIRAGAADWNPNHVNFRNCTQKSSMSEENKNNSGNCQRKTMSWNKSKQKRNMFLKA